MDIITACNILEIETIKDLTMDQLKKKYHKMALQNHPDKNGNTPESTKKFQLIQEAYELLKQEICFFDEREERENEGENKREKDEESSTYLFLLQIFIDGLIQGTGPYHTIITSIVKNIVNGCKELSLKILEDADCNTCLFIYDFFIKYKNVLGIDDDLLERLKDTISNKGMQLFIVNPSFNDLFSCNVYKLSIEEKSYFVPLWHHELYFDEGIIVKCIPELPENIEIDEDNNIHIELRIPFTFSLLNSKFLPLNLGNHQVFVPMNELRITKVQSTTLKKQGISCINEKNMYDIETKSDIIVKIIFE
uniref:J domain-containing protein n=1 Tax=viral metagenome TaxID=1070528 RepID=A0A6C0B9K8_9ZZZZ